MTTVRMPSAAAVCSRCRIAGRQATIGGGLIGDFSVIGSPERWTQVPPVYTSGRSDPASAESATSRKAASKDPLVASMGEPA
jgi:hypothetical protein